MRYNAQVYSYTLLAKATGVSTCLCVPKAVLKLWQKLTLSKHAANGSFSSHENDYFTNFY
jgi:hypothetical protein